MSPTTPVPLSASRISHVFIFARDLRRMLEFYRDTLGMRVCFEQDDCAFLRTADDRGPAIALYSGRKTPIGEGGHWFLVIDVPNVENAVAALKERGVAVEDIVAEPFGKYAKFKDPEGNVLEVHEPARGGS